MSPRQPDLDYPEASSGPSRPDDKLARQVHRALAHLHDPAYLQILPLVPLASPRSVPRGGSLGRTLQQSLLDAIDSLRPGPRAPARARNGRLYELLRWRYVEALEIHAVCDRLAIGRSEYFRDHRRAVEAVASALGQTWTLGSRRGTSADDRSGAKATASSRAETGELTIVNAANLPTLLTSFVGREREMAEVKRLLGQNRLLTLTGTGGCGKTRLALESARSLLDAYPDGIWLVQLAPIAEPRQVGLAIASSLEITERAGEPILRTLTRHLQSSHLLLLLDNCEHLLDECARVSETLLESCPSLSILATSRQPLGIGGEITLYIPSLDSPREEGWRTQEALLEAVLSHDATQLFLERARSALPSFAASTANASAVAEICRRLDGIPLAIELAAARVRALSPDQIASRLDHDFHLLTGGSRTALPRQQTLRATLDWSHNLLSEQEQALLRRLSAFARGFVLEGAEKVCAGEGVEELEVVNLLSMLVDKSLVEAGAREGEPRYRLLEPVRQYSWHRLEESGEVDAVRQRHARWLAEYTSRSEGESRGPKEPAWMKRVAPENDDVRVALAWCLHHDPQLGMLLAGNMYNYWLTAGVKSERSRWLDELLARDPRPSAARGQILGSATLELFHEADYDRAMLLGGEHLSLCLEYAEREAGPPLNALAIVAAEQGDHGRARALLEQAEAIGRKYDDTVSLATTQLFAAYDAWLCGDQPRARRLSEESLAGHRALGTPYAGLVHWMLGSVASSEGEYASARAQFETGLEKLRSIWQALDMSRCLGGLGYLSLREGDLEGARRDLSEALRLVSREYRARIAPYVAYLALVAALEGDVTGSARLAGAAEAANRFVRTTLPPDQLAHLDACLAEVRAASGEDAFARAWAEGQAMTLEEAVEYALENCGGR